MKIIAIFVSLCIFAICSGKAFILLIRKILRSTKTINLTAAAQTIWEPDNVNIPSIPVPRPDSTGWTQRHAQFIVNTANNPNIPIIFYGDR